MQRRNFLETLGWMAAMSAIPAETLVAANVVEGDQKPGKLLYFDLSTEWEHPPTVDEADGTSFAAKIVKKLGESLGYEVICTKDGSIFDGDLSAYRAIVFYTCGDLDRAPENRTGISVKGYEHLLRSIRRGTGFLGIHSATDTWQCTGELWENQPEVDRTEYIRMIGGDFITHGSVQEATLTITEPVQLPSLQTFTDRKLRFRDEWYTMKNFNPDMHVLLVQETDGMAKDGGNACYERPLYPSTWVRKEGEGRVAYTAFGHDKEMWQTPLVQAVLTDLIRFVTNDLELDLTPNLEQVCPEASILRR
ncbi:MAG: ThuA domain-containing protein [Thermoguttaceae bacterium]|nr:ThuA domain-containing protein [Thermoguttaceae bacterium]